MDSSVSSLASSDELDNRAFRFFDLPSELRMRIYEILLLRPKAIDLDPTNHKTLSWRFALFLVSHRMHREAYHVFYGSNTFRLFPVHGRFFHTKCPLFMRLPPSYRAAITSLELRLGPGWTKPPRCWTVDEKLGLRHAASLKTLKIFVECDPASDRIFEGFRVGPDFYTDFCKNLVKGLMKQVPTIVEVQFDGYPSVLKTSPLLQALVNEVKADQKRITWGPERGWDKVVDVDLGCILGKLSLGAP